MLKHARMWGALATALAGAISVLAAAIPAAAQAGQPIADPQGRPPAAAPAPPLLKALGLPPTGTPLDTVTLPTVALPELPGGLLPSLAKPPEGNGPGVTAGPQPVTPRTSARVQIGAAASARRGRPGSPASPVRGERSGGSPPAPPRAGVTRPAATPRSSPREAPVASPAARPDPGVADSREPSGNPLGRIGRGLPFFPAQVPDWSRPLLGALLLLALLLGLRSSVAAARARRLARRGELLSGQVDILQRALIPELPEHLGLLSLSAAYCPADGLGGGGDFYDAFPLADGRVGVILGDVAGHGCGALQRATLMRYTVRAYVEAGFEPRAALKLAGRVCPADEQNQFTTVVVAVFDEVAGVMTYALAGHPPPLLLGTALREPLSVLASPPLGLGLPTGLRQTSVSLSTGAVACFFTDGLVEARAGGVMAGRDHLERLLLMLDPGSDGARDLLDSLRETVDQATDDMAVCMVRSDGPTPSVPLHLEELEIEPGDVGSGGAAEFLTACGVPPDEIHAGVAAAEAVEGGAGVVIRVRLGEASATAEVHGLDHGIDHPHWDVTSPADRHRIEVSGQFGVRTTNSVAK